jgi:hypothetical protein
MYKFVITQVNAHAACMKPVEKKLRFAVFAEKSPGRILISFVKSGGISRSYAALSLLNPLTSIYR